ncbi:MAG: hypothetical protein ACI4UK_09465, partial [Floccifex sp.]
NLVALLLALMCLLINSLVLGGGTGLIFVFVIAYVSSKIGYNPEKLMLLTIKLLLGGTVFVFTLSLVGILPDTSSSRTLGYELGSFFAKTYNRHSFGFLAANQIPLTLLLSYVMLLVIKKEKITLFENTIFFIVNFLCLYWCGSRTSFILLFFAVVAYIITRFCFAKYMKREKDKKYNLAWCVFLVCAVVSVISAIKYDIGSSTWAYINNVFMDRMRMSNFAIRQYGITLFGSGLQVTRNIVGIDNATVDNGYMNMLLQHGIIISAMILAIWCNMAYRAEKGKNLYMLLALCIFAVANLLDSHLISYKVIPFYCFYFYRGNEQYGVYKKAIRRRLKW